MISDMRCVGLGFGNMKLESNHVPIYKGFRTVRFFQNVVIEHPKIANLNSLAQKWRKSSRIDLAFWN